MGVRLELTVGLVAHGGHCVARADDGRVVFVRHTLPGEQVIAVVTEERPGYLRADAVEIRSASPDRVTPPCRFAGPDRCGGCDFQHVSPSAQRDLKAAVVVEQLTRLARLTPAEIEALRVRVEPLAWPAGALGWRSRLRYTVDASGRAGLLKHRSHEVVPIDVCVIARPEIQALTVTRDAWPDDDDVEVVASSLGDVTVLASSAADSVGHSGLGDGDSGLRSNPGGRPSGGHGPGSAAGGGRPRRVTGPARVREAVGHREWRLDPATFWQVHPAAPDTFVSTAVEMLAPRPGERAWDLYGGSGIFAAALAERVGERGRVTLVESDARAVVSASESLADLGNVTIVQSMVERAKLPARPDVVVLDPPRAGAGAQVVRMLMAAAPRAIAYVACDPAAFARDVATFRAGGWQLSALRAFDAFPMTHHIECVGLITPATPSR